MKCRGVFRTDYQDLRQKLTQCAWDWCVVDNESRHVLAIIEYDGEGHFNHISNWKNPCLRDWRKTRAAIVDEIPLLRIAYPDLERVDELTKKFLEMVKGGETGFFVSPNFLKELDESDYTRSNWEKWKSFVHANAVVLE